MKCYACNCRLSPDRDTCPKCGADIRLYRKIIYASNQYYNLGLVRAKARDRLSVKIFVTEEILLMTI